MTTAERMKNSYVRAKDSAGQAQGGEEQGSPVEYAEDRAARWAEQTAREGTHQFSLCSDGVKWFQEKKQFQDGVTFRCRGTSSFLTGEMTGASTMWELWRT